MSTLFKTSKRPKGSTTEVSSTSLSHENQQKRQPESKRGPVIATFTDIELSPPLLQTCNALGYKTPTPIQKTVIPYLLSHTSHHILALASTGSGKTAAFVLPILHHLSRDPYGIYAVILTPTRELAKQIYEQVLALGSSVRVKAVLVIGGMDMTAQACELSQKPHFCIATPGRLGALLRGPNPPILKNIRYCVLDEADRLLNGQSGFEGDVAEVLLHGTTRASMEGTRERRINCQTLLFSATLTRSLESLEEMAGAGMGRLPLKRFVIKNDKDVKKKKRKHSEAGGSDSDSDGSDSDSSSSSEDSSSIPNIPSGLRQEYVFMPSHVRDAYLMTTVRHLMANGGRKGGGKVDRRDASGWNSTKASISIDDDDQETQAKKAKSAVVFVSTCERAALISGIMTELGVSNVALHSLLTQNRRLASLGKFKSQQVRVLVATDVASRGLDIPEVDLVINSELPRKAVDYIHRVGRTARAGRRGRAVSLIGERDVSLVHACEQMSGREMKKCEEVDDDLAVKMLSAVTKASKLARMKLDDIGFDELVKKMKERKIRDRKERERASRAARKTLKKARGKI